MQGFLLAVGGRNGENYIKEMASASNSFTG